MTRELVEVGRFCPSEVCPDYGKVDVGNIIRFGRTRNSTQRYRCKVCGQTFTETRGTLFCRRRTDPKDILESLALLAEGVRISSIARAKGFKEDAILSWLRAARPLGHCLAGVKAGQKVGHLVRIVGIRPIDQARQQPVHLCIMVAFPRPMTPWGISA